MCDTKSRSFGVYTVVEYNYQAATAADYLEWKRINISTNKFISVFIPS
jgi:hypothetical protein